MEDTMSESLEIALSAEALDEGSAEERATFGMFTVRANKMALTEGYDSFIHALRDGPLVSGYHAAEWFAWNWWRLLYDPYRERSAAWSVSHRMSGIGEGYVWPNLEIRSDGHRAVIISRSSSRQDAQPFRFIGSATPWLGSRAMLEVALETFINSVVARLSTSQICNTNLQVLWREVQVERRDPDAALRRQLEALMGLVPDVASEAALDGLVADTKVLGREAVEELAADASNGNPLRAADLRQLSHASRLRSHRNDAVRLPAAALTAIRKQEIAWQQGKLAAKHLRRQEGFGEGRVETHRLLELLGAAGDVDEATEAPMSFLLEGNRQEAVIVLRLRYETGQRFDLARLLGDHLVIGRGLPALPATQAYTFRQKAQRSFAAEFLAPFDTVDAMLAGDYSEESIEKVATYFEVSNWTIRTLLMNHNRLERELLADVA
jgi:hypothetical protein